MDRIDRAAAPVGDAVERRVATLSGSYTLQGKLDLSETGANKGTAAMAAGMWAQTGFVPIGTDGTGNVYDASTSAFGTNGIAGFSGNFNGGGYTPSNLTVNRPTANDAGLFG